MLSLARFSAFQRHRVNNARAGFLLTRHWRDTPNGTEIVLWLATDNGPQRLVLPPQESVAFLPAEYQQQARQLLADERDWRLLPLALKDFRHRPVLGLDCAQYRQLQRLEKRVREQAMLRCGADVARYRNHPAWRTLLHRRRRLWSAHRVDAGAGKRRRQPARL